MFVEEMRLTSDNIRYGFAVGKVRVLETKALDRAAFERLLDAHSFSEQKRLLSESPYGRFLERAETAEDVERGLAEALDSFYRFLSQADLPSAVTRFFLLRYDFANLKAAAKARLLGVPVDDLLIGHGLVPKEAFAGDLRALPAPLDAAAARLPLSEATAGGSTDAAAMAIDTSVDRAMFAELVSTAEEAQSGYLVELARLAIDIANARTLVRARLAGFRPAVVRELLILGGSASVADLAKLSELPEKELSAALARIPSLRQLPAEDVSSAGSLDVALDAVGEAASRRGKTGGQVGPDPVISYVLAREQEVRALRVLLLGKLTGIDRETLRARLHAVR